MVQDTPQINGIVSTFIQDFDIIFLVIIILLYYKYIITFFIKE